MINKFIALSLFALATCATARAQSAYDNYSGNPIFAYSNGTSVGQSFLTGPGPLVLTDVLFPQVTGFGPNFTDGYTAGETFSLYTNGAVTGADGNVHNGPSVMVPITFSLSHNFTPSTGAGGDLGGTTTATALLPVLLTGSTRYWLVLNAPNATSQVYWNYADMGVNTMYQSTSSGGVDLPAGDSSYELNNPNAPGYVFYSYASGPQQLIINPVPEPSSLCLLGLAGVGAFVVARRVRSAKVA